MTASHAVRMPFEISDVARRSSGGIVVMDDRVSHKRPPPVAVIEAAGATVRCPS